MFKYYSGQTIFPQGSLETYAVLDSGSGTSLVWEEIINQLDLKSREALINITTVKCTNTYQFFKIILEIFSLHDNEFIQLSRADTIKKSAFDVAEPLIEQQLRR